MPDLTTSAIERFFDKIDGAVFVAGRVLERAHEFVRCSQNHCGEVLADTQPSKFERHQRKDDAARLQLA